MIDRRPVVSANYGVANCRDVYYARRVARVVGSDHHWFDLPNGEWVKENADLHLELTEGFHSWIHAHGMSVLPSIRPLMDVALTGWGGGNPRGVPESPVPPFRPAGGDMELMGRLFHLFNQHYTWPSVTEEEEEVLYTDPWRRSLRGLAFDSLCEEFRRYGLHRQDLRPKYFRIRNLDWRFTFNLVTFARSHVEVRFPLFDYDFFDFVYSAPSRLRDNLALYRGIIQREVPRLAYIPYEYDELLPTTHRWVRKAHALAMKVKRRAKRHLLPFLPEIHTLYADYENYLRSDLREWGESILFDERTLERGIFSPAFLRSIWARHQSGQEMHTIGKIAPIMTYEMMLRRLYD